MLPRVDPGRSKEKTGKTVSSAPHDVGTIEYPWILGAVQVSMHIAVLNSAVSISYVSKVWRGQ